MTRDEAERRRRDFFNSLQAGEVKMNKNPKKVIAATIGVIQYLKAERERALRKQAAASRAPRPSVSRQVQPSGSVWAASGRREVMRFRNLMELRVFRRGR